MLKRLGELKDGFELELGLEASQRRQEALQLRQEAQQLRQEAQQLRQEAQQLRQEAQEESGQRQQENEQRQREIAKTQQEIAKTQQELVTLGTNVKREIDRVFQKQQQVSSELVLQNQRLTLVLEEARQRLAATFDQDQLQALVREDTHALDAFYASFDERFRGSKEEIKERLKVYLPFVKAAGVGSKSMQILDVGCGRGEWLELLGEQGFSVVGVDANRILVAQCRERGLDVVEDDLMNYMRALPDASLGGITGFHIVEHLAIETLVKFLNETMRVLKPGGVVIFETPNPENVLVGSCNFYFDPTHRNPLPAQVLRFLVESRGFVEVKILNLNPSDDVPVEGDSDLAKRFNQYFYGPMDYGLVAWKISEETINDRRWTIDDGRWTMDDGR